MDVVISQSGVVTDVFAYKTNSTR